MKTKKERHEENWPTAKMKEEDNEESIGEEIEKEKSLKELACGQ